MLHVVVALLLKQVQHITRKSYQLKYALNAIRFLPVSKNWLIQLDVLISSRRNTDLNDDLNSIDRILLKRQSINLACLFLSFSLLFPGSPTYADCKNLPVAETVRYQTIFDGDTILLEDGRKIRLIGINTPEIGRKGRPSEPFAKKAKQKLGFILSSSHRLNLSYDLAKKDRFKRTLAYIYLLDGTDVQAEMLSSGLARSIVISPNEKNLTC